jgi:hypothetical protein
MTPLSEDGHLPTGEKKYLVQIPLLLKKSF